ncbi:MAG TPA: hypothetical protein PKC18_12320, partial [Lacipirellulaceae bacterium]|nr:hypothetical protein [Lacipirellulaceae bacterium]
SWPDVSYRGRKAVGVTGINGHALGQFESKLCQITMTCDVGRSHYIKPHMASSRLVNLLCCFAFPECMACLEAPATAGTETADAGIPVAGGAPRAFFEVGAWRPAAGVHFPGSRPADIRR